MSSYAEFAINLDKAFADSMDHVIAVQKKVALEALRRVIMKSPVGNPDLWKSKPPPGYAGGRFRANWMVAIGVKPDGTVTTIDPSGNETLAEGARPISALNDFDIVWLVNNLPYAEEIERGHSTQAPAGVVAVTVAELDAFFNQVTQ